jgi:site-specific DNA-methyltransferase (adenine-specific)
MTVQIINGDCRDVLASYPDDSFDCILTDPPYGETSLEWDRWVDGWPAMVRRLLKPSGSMWVFGSMRMFWDHRDDFDGWKLAQDVVWEKHNGSGFANDRFKRVHENVIHLYRDDAPWSEVYKSPQFTNDATARRVSRRKQPTHTGVIGDGEYLSVTNGPRLMRSVMYVRSEHGKARHPTQKPLGIVEPLLLYSCPVGGRVLDPFAGSGTTGLAARRHGMDALLIEGKPEFEAIIHERLADDAPLLGEVA